MSVCVINYIHPATCSPKTHEISGNFYVLLPKPRPGKVGSFKPLQTLPKTHHHLLVNYAAQESQIREIWEDAGTLCEWKPKGAQGSLAV